MTLRYRTHVAFITIGASTFIACRSDLSVAPSEGSRLTSRVASTGIGVAGTYTLGFFDNWLRPITSLEVGGPELILGARITDAAGSPATRGSVTFQYCSYKGLPPNDITRADEAPSIACATGTASWERLLSIAVNESGWAFMNFGFVMIPRTVGFRARYSPQGGGIASGTSSASDFTWVANN